MNKFRASFSILDTWNKGDYENAVKMYFKIDSFENEAMRQGKKYHKEWSKHTEETKTLPVIFGGKEFKTPKTELKLTAQIYDWLEMVGVVDCVDEPVIYEYKTGVTDSQTYVNSHQVGMYGLLLTYNDMLVDRCEFYHYNQYKNQVDMSIVHITDKLIENSLNFVVTTAGEMHEYLESNNLYEKLNK